MKATNKVLSVILCTMILLSVLMSAPFSVSAVETDNISKTDKITVSKSDVENVAVIKANSKKNDIADTSFIDINFDECEKIVYEGVIYLVYESDKLLISGYVENELPENLVIPKAVNGYSVEQIWYNAFMNCQKLISVTLPSTIKSNIRENAFGNCVNLESVVFEEGIKSKSLEGSVFNGCKSLKSIKIPASIVDIANTCFSDCVNLEKVSFEKNSKLESIGMDAFGGCESLTSIEIPPSCKRIYDGAFGSCYSLSEVKLNEGLVDVCEMAFYNCFSLLQINVPKSVQTIESLAFGCFDMDGEVYCFLNFTLLGYKDSLADEYAKAYGMKYALPAPILSKVENKTDGIKISFKNLSGVSGKYRVYRKTEGSSWKTLADVTGSSYTDKSAKAGVKYAYTVKYIGKPANSVYDTDGISIIRLTTPTVSKIENTNDGAKITINAVAGAAKYRVYVRSDSKWKSLGVTDTTTFTHTGAKSGKTYKYTVRAYDASGKYYSVYNSSGFSNKFVAPPKITKLSNTATGIKITWDKVEGAEKYRVFVKSGSKWKKLKDTTSTSYTHTSVESGKTYTYTVRCISSTGKSYKSGYDTVGTSRLFLATPVVKSISNTIDGAKITFTAVEGAARYNVYAKSDSSWNKIGETTETTFVHDTAKSGTTYSYRLRAYDETGEYVSYYKVSDKNTFIAAPVIKELKCTSKGVKITWDKVTGAEKYRVFIKSGSKWKKLKDTTSTSYTHTSVDSGKTYTYTVRCISSTGKSYKSGYDTVGKSVVYEK